MSGPYRTAAELPEEEKEMSPMTAQEMNFRLWRLGIVCLTIFAFLFFGGLIGDGYMKHWEATITAKEERLAQEAKAQKAKSEADKAMFERMTGDHK